MQHENFGQIAYNNPELELSFVDILTDPAKASVDIGAYLGTYTERLATNSAYVFAYEPLIEFATGLRDRMAAAPVSVRSFALSDQDGRSTLYTPTYAFDRAAPTSLYSYSSLVKNFEFETSSFPERFVGVTNRSVETRTLDSEAHGNLGFIKIDVEGAELQVLHGARRTLAAQHPVLLVESENRHRKNAVLEVTSYLQKFDYKGFFIHKGQLRSIDEFSAQDMQPYDPFPLLRARGYQYCNNFIFVPPAETRIVSRIEERLRCPTSG